MFRNFPMPGKMSEPGNYMQTAYCSIYLCLSLICDGVRSLFSANLFQTKDTLLVWGRLILYEKSRIVFSSAYRWKNNFWLALQMATEIKETTVVTLWWLADLILVLMWSCCEEKKSSDRLLTNIYPSSIIQDNMTVSCHLNTPDRVEGFWFCR